MCFNATKSYKILMLRPDVTSGFVVETQHYFTCKCEPPLTHATMFLRHCKVVARVIWMVARWS